MNDGSLPVLGPKLFNCLPKDTREFDGSFESFKGQVDRFLSAIPDRPCLPQYHQSAHSNRILKQLEQVRAESAH